MAINVYTGLMGSGKSFEVVSSVILPALSKGRRVVTNIDGIDFEKIKEYITEKKKIPYDKIGHLISCTNDDVCKTSFFPDETKPENVSIVQPGDLICIYECWNFWGQEHKISDEHMRFFRMHRHYTCPQTGLGCDLALMIQDLGTLNRKIKSVIELTSRTVKLKSLGVPTAYRIELYEGNKISKLSKIDTFVKKYDKAIFPLYKSYASSNGKEVVIDSRQNLLTNPKIYIVLLLCIVTIIFSVYYVSKFFASPISEKQSKQLDQPSSPTIQNNTVISSITNELQPIEFSEKYRFVGRFVINGQNWTLIADSMGRLRPEIGSTFTGSGITSSGIVDQRVVTVFSGPSNASTFMPN